MAVRHSLTYRFLRHTLATTQFFPQVLLLQALGMPSMASADRRGRRVGERPAPRLARTAKAHNPREQTCFFRGSDLQSKGG